jgi:hypothetical protein
MSEMQTAIERMMVVLVVNAPLPPLRVAPRVVVPPGSKTRAPALGTVMLYKATLPAPVALMLMQ